MASGTIHADAIGTEHTVHAKSGLNGLVYQGWGQNCYQVTASKPDESNPYEPSGLFAKSLIQSGQGDLNKARQMLQKGKAVALAQPESVRDRFLKMIAKKRSEPHKVKSLALTQKDLTMLPDELFVFENLEKLDLTHNQLRTLPDAPDLEKSKEWANDHIRFWFSCDYIRPDYFYNYKTQTYSFDDITALLNIVISCLVPVAAPYTGSLSFFKKECAEIVRRLHWAEDVGQKHVNNVFAALSKALQEIPCDEELRAPLTDLFKSLLTTSKHQPE